MKLSNFSVLLLGLCLMLNSSCKKEKTGGIPCLPASLQSDLLAFYPFSNGSINDFSGNNHHLTNTSAAHAAADRNGNPTCAFQFDNNIAGNNDFLMTNNTTFLNGLSEYSVSIWYQPQDSSRSGGSFEVLMSRDQGGSCPDRVGQWSVGLYDCRKAVFGRLNSVWDTNTTAFDCQEEIYIRTGTWQHVVATYDQATEEMKIYRNGVLQNTSTGIAGCGANPTISDIGDLFLGTHYSGKLDDIMIYKKVLSATEVNELYTLGSCCSE